MFNLIIIREMENKMIMSKSLHHTLTLITPKMGNNMHQE